MRETVKTSKVAAKEAIGDPIDCFVALVYALKSLPFSPFIAVFDFTLVPHGKIVN